MERSDRYFTVFAGGPAPAPIHYPLGSNDPDGLQPVSPEDPQQIIPKSLEGELDQYSHADGFPGFIPPPPFSYQYVPNDDNTGGPCQYAHADGFPYQYMSSSNSNFGGGADQFSCADEFPGQPLPGYSLHQYQLDGDNSGGELSQYLDADGYHGAISQDSPLTFSDFLQNTPAADDYWSEPTHHMNTDDLHGTAPPSLTFRNPQDILNGGNDGGQSSGDLKPSELEPPTSQVSQSLTALINTVDVAPKCGNKATRKFEHVRVWSGNLIGQHKRFRVGKSSHIKCLYRYRYSQRDCHKIFKTKRDFERHYNSVHEYRKQDFRCPKCYHSSSREDNLLNHRRTIHNENIPKRKVRFGSGQPRKGAKPVKKDAEGSQQ